MYVVWLDTKCISVLPSKHPGHSDFTVVRNVRDHKNQHQRAEFPILSAVFHYNKTWLVYTAPINLSSIIMFCVKPKNIGRLFFHFVDISVVNAYSLNN